MCDIIVGMLINKVSVKDSVFFIIFVVCEFASREWLLGRFQRGVKYS